MLPRATGAEAFFNGAAYIDCWMSCVPHMFFARELMNGAKSQHLMAMLGELTVLQRRGIVSALSSRLSEGSVCRGGMASAKL